MTVQSGKYYVRRTISFGAGSVVQIVGEPSRHGKTIMTPRQVINSAPRPMIEKWLSSGAIEPYDPDVHRDAILNPQAIRDAAYASSREEKAELVNNAARQAVKS